MHIERGGFNFAMSILKSDCRNCPDSCLRFTYAYENPDAWHGTVHPHLYA